MATPTFDLIQSYELAGATGAVTFSTIDTLTYNHLFLIINHNADTAGYAEIRFNGDTTVTNYRCIAGFAETTNVSREYANNNNRIFYSDGDIGVTWIWIPWASLNDRWVVALSQNNAHDNDFQFKYATTWENTSRVTSITIDGGSSGDFGSGSYFSLFGVE